MLDKKEMLVDTLKRNFFVPLVTLALTLVSFALLSPKLGFYLDDWPQLFALVKHGSEGIKQYFLYDGRPFGYWPDLFFYSLWGTNPFLWHLANYLMRWLVGVFFWLTLCQIWPEHRREAGWAAALFCVFPLFNQQSMGLTFIAHWACYVLFMLSIYLMVLGIKKPKYRVWFFVLSILVDVPNLFTYENFIGVEFLRPFFLWFALPNVAAIKARLKKTLVNWLPFLGLAFFYIVWRLFIMKNLRADTTPVLLTNFLSQPGATLISFLTLFTKDILYIILNVWYQVFSVENFDFSVPSSVLTIFLTAIVIIAPVLFLLWERRHKETTGEQKDHFNRDMLLMGLAGIIFGCLPGWIILRSVSDASGIWNDRFGLPAMFSASLFVVGLISWLTGQQRLKREIIFVILIGFSVGHNFLVTNDYRWSSVYANRFFSQLYWRAPYIESETTLLSDNEFISKFGVYPTSYAINLLYPSTKGQTELDYWFLTLSKYFPGKIDELAEGIPIQQGRYYSTYRANSKDSLVLGWHSDSPQCVWVLTEKDRYNPFLGEDTINALGASNLTRINPQKTGLDFSQDLFGSENRNTWCYFYEKADLARQSGDWAGVIQLYDEALAKGYKQDNQTEIMPFIEAFIHEGDLDSALQLTLDADNKDPRVELFLCDNWARIAKELSVDTNVQNAYQTLDAQFECTALLPQE